MLNLDWTTLAPIIIAALLIFFPQLRTVLVPILEQILKVLKPASAAPADADAAVTQAWQTVFRQCKCAESQKLATDLLLKLNPAPATK